MSLQNILDQAKTAATALTPVAPAAFAAPAAFQAPTALAAPSMDAFENAGGLSVEHFLGVPAAGIKIGKDMKGALDELIVDIDFSEVMPFWGIRKTVGQTTTYAKSYNGATTVRGENFAGVAAEFAAADPRATPYPGADIPCTLVEDVADPKDKARTFPAGTRVGYTTSVTGFAPFNTFFKKLKAAGLHTGTLRVKLIHEVKQKQGVQDWGVIGKFEVLGQVGADGQLIQQAA